VLALLTLGSLAQAAEPGRESFDAGVAAYRAGDVAGALVAFERARASGYDTPQLRFNLGLSYYRLKRYAESRAQFEGLRREPGYAGVADFHLGLIAAREGDRTRAESLWRSLESGSDAGLAQRAGIALGRLDGDAAEPVAAGYLLLAAGYDSNPGQLDDSLLPAGSADSADVEVFGAFNLPLGGDARAFTSLRGGGYLKNYTEETGQDQSGAFAGFGRDFDDGTRRLAWGLDASTGTVDGERFLDVYTVQAQRTPSGAVGWRLGAQASRIDAPPAYAQLEGWRARLGLARSGRVGRALARLGYEVEYNDREDLATGSDFFSQSPLRHRLDLVVEHPLGARTSLRWNLRYRNSRYRDPDVTAGGEVRRQEDLALAGAQLRRRLGPATYALAELQYSRNDATPAVFEYERVTALLGLEWTPSAK
jgi:tetratricopeptide (TPR) repeat protein